MSITASLVKELREKTGVGMMDCKKALQESNGNFEAAEKYLREKGLAAASKKSDRSTKEGRIFISQQGSNAVILELNCETDFVATNDDFISTGQVISDAILASSASSLNELSSISINGVPFETFTAEAVLKMGENISVKQFERLSAKGSVASYIHMNGKIGVAIAFSSQVDENDGKDIAMHIAATNPEFLRSNEVPESKLNEEREVTAAQLRNEGKPDAIIEKIVEGKIAKYLKEICLVDQPFVKNPDQKVKDIVAENQFESFYRFAI